ncbi:MAG: alpha-mannosidase [Clostridia bacterium]|nr:alpha-mannosidase [Clostridia bacterium]
MAHIKVTRRSMRPEEWTSLRFGWLKKYIIENRYEINSLQIRDARQISEMNYEYYSDDYRPLKKGDMYFTPDGTAFIKGDVTVPVSFRDKQLWLYLKTAAEIIVKVNGKYVGGLDPNRDKVLLSGYIDSDELHFEMQGYNRSKPDDERNPESLSVRGCRQVFEGAYLVTVNKEVLDLVYDFEVLLDIANSELFNEDYRSFLHRELNNAMNLIDFDDEVELVGVKEAKEYIENVIYANKTYKGNGDVALIAHSHLDLAYYWRRIHSVQKNLRTVLIQLRLMDRYPEFKYTHTQAYTYETLEKYYPEVFSELKEKIANGRFEPVGAMYVEPDCNIPSAESLIRQCLYGQNYFKEKFGKRVGNCWLPDVFGNSWILPQILKKSGVDYFVSNKMSTWNDTNRFPHNNFIWKGIDGSEVYACVPPTHFITWNMPSQIQENWEAYQDKDVGGQTMSMFGYGDGGSGVTEEMLEMMKRFKKISVMPKTEHVSAKAFLESNLKNNTSLSKWDGELYLEMHRGTFTTKSKLKQFNRRLEFKLREAEIISVLRAMSGKAYPRQMLTECYKKLLINQFHDILPGSHINPVYHDAINDYKEIESALNGIIGTADKYFNSLNFKRSFITFIEDENGKNIRHSKKGFWTIPGLPALSCGELYDSTFSECDWLNIGSDYIETPYYRIRFNDDGSFESLFDLINEREWVNGEFNKLKAYSDNPGVYDAWDILPNYKEKPVEIKTVSPIKLVSKNSAVAEFEVIHQIGKSKWKRLIRLFSESAAIEVENIVDWSEKQRLVKAHFDCNVLTREATCDIGAGYIKRPTHSNTSWEQARFEVCHHKWCDLSQTDGGVALINEGKYGVGFSESTMSLSLLRGTVRPDVYSDMGHHDFCYLIMPHASGPVEAEINKAAFEYNIPLTKSDVSCANTFDGLFLQAMKMSEKDSTVVVRLSEQDGKSGTLKFPKPVKIMNLLEDVIETSDTVNYSPFEILTIGIN